jgi:hypothetical protein
MNRTKSLAIIKMAVPLLFATLFYQNCSPNKTSFSDAGISALSTGQGGQTTLPKPNPQASTPCSNCELDSNGQTTLPKPNPQASTQRCEDDKNFKKKAKEGDNDDNDDDDNDNNDNNDDDKDECEEPVVVEKDDAGENYCKLSKSINNKVQTKDISVKIDGKKLNSDKCDIQNDILTFKTDVLITNETEIKVKYKKKKLNNK